MRHYTSEFFYFLFWGFLQLLDMAGKAAIVVVYAVALAWVLIQVSEFLALGWMR